MFLFFNFFLINLSLIVCEKYVFEWKDGKITVILSEQIGPFSSLTNYCKSRNAVPLEILPDNIFDKNGMHMRRFLTENDIADNMYWVNAEPSQTGYQWKESKKIIDDWFFYSTMPKQEDCVAMQPHALTGNGTTKLSAMVRCTSEMYFSCMIMEKHKKIVSIMNNFVIHNLYGRKLCYQEKFCAIICSFDSECDASTTECDEMNFPIICKFYKSSFDRSNKGTVFFEKTGF
ncbi:hypothetical protein SNEBB_008813 [Seison nebaliae]|nr:hypothetical protein SNEBB_008813 [Seison nebaliae]